MKTIQPLRPSGQPEVGGARDHPADDLTPHAVTNALVSVVPSILGALLGIAALAGMALMLLDRPTSFDLIWAALFGQHNAWYLSRASAFASYVLLWLSMVWGLLITNRMARLWPGGPTATELHEQASLLGLGLGVVHALVLLADRYIGYSLTDILVPFAGASYRPIWVGLGQIGIYLLAIVTITFYLRRWIGRRTWRAIHMLSYGAFVLTLLHGLFSGTDSSTPWAFWMYIASGVSVTILTIYRIGMAKRAATGRRTQNSEPRTQN